MARPDCNPSGSGAYTWTKADCGLFLAYEVTVAAPHAGAINVRVGAHAKSGSDQLAAVLGPARDFASQVAKVRCTAGFPPPPPATATLDLFLIAAPADLKDPAKRRQWKCWSKCGQDNLVMNVMLIQLA
jgi:hypothetical protein